MGNLFTEKKVQNANSRTFIASLGNPLLMTTETAHKAILHGELSFTIWHTS